MVAHGFGRLPPPNPPQNYIQELRNCSSKEQEKERVDKELGKVRKKYTSDKAMSGEGVAFAPARLCLRVREWLVH